MSDIIPTFDHVYDVEPPADLTDDEVFKRDIHELTEMLSSISRSDNEGYTMYKEAESTIEDLTEMVRDLVRKHYEKLDKMIVLDELVKVNDLITRDQGERLLKALEKVNFDEMKGGRRRSRRSRKRRTKRRTKRNKRRTKRR
jgi:hypothetical protein